MTKQKNNDPERAEKTQENQFPHQESENLPIGKLIRQVREKKALTIHDISRETNISSSNLTSIELGNYNELPADTFIRGQIIIYADFLGLDGAEAARLFFEEKSRCIKGGEKKPFSQQGIGLSTRELAEPTHISSAAWAISLLLLIITFLAVFSWYTGWNPFAYFLGQQPTQVSTATAIVQPVATEQEPEDIAVPPLAPSEEQAEEPSSVAPPPETTQPTETAEQTTASE
jgi:cytoskeletal protein RodZ